MSENNEVIVASSPPSSRLSCRTTACRLPKPRLLPALTRPFRHWARNPLLPLKKSPLRLFQSRNRSPGFLICLEDGKKFKSLKRHLRTAYDMTPEGNTRANGGFRRLPHGRSRLCRGTLDAGKTNGSWKPTSKGCSGSVHCPRQGRARQGTRLILTPGRGLRLSKSDGARTRAFIRIALTASFGGSVSV